MNRPPAQKTQAQLLAAQQKRAEAKAAKEKHEQHLARLRSMSFGKDGTAIIGGATNLGKDDQRTDLTSKLAQKLHEQRKDPQYPISPWTGYKLLKHITPPEILQDMIEDKSVCPPFDLLQLHKTRPSSQRWYTYGIVLSAKLVREDSALVRLRHYRINALEDSKAECCLWLNGDAVQLVSKNKIREAQVIIVGGPIVQDNTQGLSRNKTGDNSKFTGDGYDSHRNNFFAKNNNIGGGNNSNINHDIYSAFGCPYKLSTSDPDTILIEGYPVDVGHCVSYSQVRQQNGTETTVSRCTNVIHYAKNYMCDFHLGQEQKRSKIKYTALTRSDAVDDTVLLAHNQRIIRHGGLTHANQDIIHVPTAEGMVSGYVVNDKLSAGLKKQEEYEALRKQQEQALIAANRRAILGSSKYDNNNGDDDAEDPFAEKKSLYKKSTSTQNSNDPFASNGPTTFNPFKNNTTSSSGNVSLFGKKDNNTTTTTEKTSLYAKKPVVNPFKMAMGGGASQQQQQSQHDTISTKKAWGAQNNTNNNKIIDDDDAERAAQEQYESDLLAQMEYENEQQDLLREFDSMYDDDDQVQKNNTKQPHQEKKNNHDDNVVLNAQIQNNDSYTSHTSIDDVDNPFLQAEDDFANPFDDADLLNDFFEVEEQMNSILGINGSNAKADTAIKTSVNTNDENNNGQKNNKKENDNNKNTTFDELFGADDDEDNNNVTVIANNNNNNKSAPLKQQQIKQEPSTLKDKIIAKKKRRKSTSSSSSSGSDSSSSDSSSDSSSSSSSDSSSSDSEDEKQKSRKLQKPQSTLPPPSVAQPPGSAVKKSLYSKQLPKSTVTDPALGQVKSEVGNGTSITKTSSSSLQQQSAPPPSAQKKSLYSRSSAYQPDKPTGPLFRFGADAILAQELEAERQTAFNRNSTHTVNPFNTTSTSTGTDGTPAKSYNRKMLEESEQVFFTKKGSAEVPDFNSKSRASLYSKEAREARATEQFKNSVLYMNTSGQELHANPKTAGQRPRTLGEITQGLAGNGMIKRETSVKLEDHLQQTPQKLLMPPPTQQQQQKLAMPSQQIQYLQPQLKLPSQQHMPGQQYVPSNVNNNNNAGSSIPRIQSQSQVNQQKLALLQRQNQMILQAQQQNQQQQAELTRQLDEEAKARRLEETKQNLLASAQKRKEMVALFSPNGVKKEQGGHDADEYINDQQQHGQKRQKLNDTTSSSLNVKKPNIKKEEEQPQHTGFHFSESSESDDDEAGIETLGIERYKKIPFDEYLLNHYEIQDKTTIDRSILKRYKKQYEMWLEEDKTKWKELKRRKIANRGAHLKAVARVEALNPILTIQDKMAQVMEMKMIVKCCLKRGCGHFTTWRTSLAPTCFTEGHEFKSKEAICTCFKCQRCRYITKIYDQAFPTERCHCTTRGKDPDWMQISYYEATGKLKPQIAVNEEYTQGSGVLQTNSGALYLRIDDELNRVRGGISKNVEEDELSRIHTDRVDFEYD